MILITAKVHPSLIKSLEAYNLQVIYKPTITYEEVLQQINNVQGLIVTTRIKIDKKIIDQATNLKWIGRLGSGMELIDTEYATSKKIVCISSPEGNCNAVAEHALGLLLAAKNNIVQSSNQIKKGLWQREQNRGNEIIGNTFGIIGFGNTGSTFAKLLQVFGGTILVYDKYKTDFGGKFVREADIDQIVKYADVISFHVPLSAQTANMANEVFFNSLKNKPFIINTSRGNVINTNALVNALKENKICGAALDVLENENLATLTKPQREDLDFLLADERVLITPHIAGYSNQSFVKMGTILIDKLKLNNLLP
jgi:D-3-phosphoglycerate dehydrogenase / 2-oxoglutarate reductase